MLHRFGKVINHRKKALASILATYGIITAGAMAGLFAAFPVCAAEKAASAECYTSTNR